MRLYHALVAAGLSDSGTIRAPWSVCLCCVEREVLSEKEDILGWSC